MPFAERAGVRIHFRDEGAGPLLVLHTGGAGDGTMWDGAGYTARLGGFRLLVMDHRGRGQSSRADDLAGHARGQYADDVDHPPEWLRRNFDETDPGQLALSLRAWAAEGDTTWDDLACIACPTALVAGSEEAPPGSLERMAAAIPGGAAIARLEGLGHVGAFLDSEAVLRAALPVLSAGSGNTPSVDFPR